MIFHKRVTSSDENDQGIAVSVVRQACNRLIIVSQGPWEGCATSFFFWANLDACASSLQFMNFSKTRVGRRRESICFDEKPDQGAHA